MLQEQIEDVLDVRPVGDRQQMLGARKRQWTQPGAQAAREDQGLQLPEIVREETPTSAIPSAMSETPIQRRVGTCSWKRNLERPTITMYETPTSGYAIERSTRERTTSQNTADTPNRASPIHSSGSFIALTSV